MSKRKTTTKTRHDTSKKIKGESPFGSHESMVVDHTQYGLTLSEDKVLCEDDGYFYITYKNRLDSGLADPNRYSSKKLFFQKL